ncbi:hypothetical protein [Bradyrhizobium elkanii]|uniref:hypothetical protein n=1 Tax=Bradyrhizobium elkanii TaxID=29448 RepID=UPI002166FF47|nr:hypothetical protein [Bradyrhizobium elkanii]MCS3690895.1 hypothetical protein [Bradyrhizobium elkanii]
MNEVERYIIRADHEWAFIYVDEKTGVFAAYSSFGTYAYCWAHIGTSTLKEFLSELDFDYFMGKTRGLELKQFDFHATIKGMKEFICDQRRQEALDKDEARDAWYDIEAIENRISVDLFVDDVYASKPICEAYGNDFEDVIRNRPDPQCVGFWRAIWPEFLKRIAAPAEAVA